MGAGETSFLSCFLPRWGHLAVQKKVAIKGDQGAHGTEWVAVGVLLVAGALFVGFPFRSNCRLRLAKSHLAYATAPLLVERTASCRTGPWGHSTRSVRHEARDRASRGSESQPLRACHSRGDRRPSRNTSEPEESNQGRRPGSAARGGDQV